ncbi:hypothetical protein L915_07345 [Phytophthora nicotianae]|uniref:Uncharacterized protein n=1 Tax=Phytophthora nicotianae TaxID=4792 RepID=W2H1F4_PHYNI|nr:hypothetical protein L915_07345 [Phytophthora nicotianae]
MRPTRQPLSSQEAENQVEHDEIGHPNRMMQGL